MRQVFQHASKALTILVFLVGCAANTYSVPPPEKPNIAPSTRLLFSSCYFCDPDPYYRELEKRYENLVTIDCAESRISPRCKDTIQAYDVARKEIKERADARLREWESKRKAREEESERELEEAKKRQEYSVALTKWKASCLNETAKRPFHWLDRDAIVEAPVATAIFSPVILLVVVLGAPSWYDVTKQARLREEYCTNLIEKNLHEFVDPALPYLQRSSARRSYFRALERAYRAASDK